MSLGLDFANIQAYPPTEAAGIVVLRLAQQDKPRVLEVVKTLIPVFETVEVARKLWIVEADRIRISR